MKLLKAEAGVNDGKAGLLSAAGLFAKGGIFDKKSESFNIQELDPYLLFDARSSMVGTLENPTLDLDPATPSTLDVITATRAGVATYTDADGLIATASPDTVRVDYVDGVPMILVEPSSVNLVTYSEDFSQSYWTKSGSSVVSGFSSPDGLNNSFKLIEDSSNQKHFIKAESTSTAGDYSRTIHAKAGERDIIQITQNGVFSNCYANFNLTSGVITASAFCDAEMEALSDGWYKCTIKATFFTRGAPIDIFNISAQVDPLANRPDIYQGDGTSGLYLWGAQLEAGSVATSYIPTSGSTVTRAADNIVISGSAFSDFYNASEGTVYAEFVPKRNDDYRHVYEFSNGTTAQRINLHLQSASAIFYSQSLGSLYEYSANSVAGATIDVLHRSAFSYKINDAPYSFDGGAEIPDAEYSVPSGINRLYLGDYTSRDGNYILTGHIKRLLFWPTHSSRL